MCRADGCGGGFIGFCVLFSCIFALGFPFYFRAIQLSIPDSGKCSQLFLQSWTQDYCIQSSSCPAIYPCGTVTWTDCTNCDGAKRTWNVTLAFVVASTICALAVAIGFWRRCCSRHRDKSNLHIGFVTSGFLLMLVAVVVFVIEEPKTVSGLQCVADALSNIDCTQFWGARSLAVGPIEVDSVWGPAGWVAACAALGCYAISMCCAFQRSQSTGGYYQPLQ